MKPKSSFPVGQHLAGKCAFPEIYFALNTWDTTSYKDHSPCDTLVQLFGLRPQAEGMLKAVPKKKDELHYYSISKNQYPLYIALFTMLHLFQDHKFTLSNITSWFC